MKPVQSRYCRHPRARTSWIPVGTYCVWTPRPRSPERCGKSKSTGSSRRWRLRDLLGRDGIFIFLSPAATDRKKVGKPADDSNSVNAAPRPSSPVKKAVPAKGSGGPAQLQALNSEISFLEDDLRTLDSLQPASISCKEVGESVVANQDHMLPQSRKSKKCRLYKRTWSLLVAAHKLLLNIPCIVYFTSEHLLVLEANARLYEKPIATLEARNMRGAKINISSHTQPRDVTDQKLLLSAKK